MTPKTKRRLLYAASLIGLDILFFGFFNPTTIPSVVLFAGFGVLAANLAAFWYLLLYVARALLARSSMRLLRPVIIATGVSTVLLALQSIGQLTVRDVAAVCALTALFWFYGSYYKSRQT